MIDPITTEIIHSRLQSIADETFIALARSAYSTNIKERFDHSTAVVDAAGRLIVQAQRALPIHLGSMIGLVGAILDRYGLDAVAEGDLYVSNDPYSAGGTHLPDVSVAMPVFSDGQLLGFVCNIAHHADIGGMHPGSMSSGMTEIYQEGLRIPLMRLMTAGKLHEEVLTLFVANARIEDERRGDYLGQIAAARLGVRRVTELVEVHTARQVALAFEDLITRTRTRLCASIARLPRGCYSYTDILDGDGSGAVDVPIKATVEAFADRIRIDFTGTGTQMPGNFNVPFNATRAAACFAVKAILDPHIPNNAGMLEVVDVFAPPGTLTNPVFPAAVANRSQTCQRLIDAIFGCFAQMIPEQAVAASNGATTTVVLTGEDDRKQRYIYLEALGGGVGGRFAKDGKDGVQANITNSSNLPIEAIEAEYPLLVEAYELIEDSGGAGRTRGGLGIRRVLRPRGESFSFSGTGERFRHAPWGIYGGGPAQPGRFALRQDDGSITALDGKVNHVLVRRGEALIVETPGGGGFGPPTERDPAALAEDAASGKFSDDFLRSRYPASGDPGPSFEPRENAQAKEHMGA